MALVALVARLRAASSGRKLLFALTALYVALPLVAVLLYSVATVWRDTIIPDGFTLEHWSTAFSDSRVIGSIGRSLLLAALAVTIDVLLVVPAVYTMHTRNPRLRAPIELAALIPFALPILVIAFGIRSLAGDVVPALQGTFWLLLIGHAAVGFPFVFWAVDAAMAAGRVKALQEAAATCGASTTRTLLRVVVPNITTGIACGAVLAMAFSLGEFALAQVLVGGIYETAPVWQAQEFTDTDADLNLLAVVTAISFALLFALTAAVVLLTRTSGWSSSPTAGAPAPAPKPR
jgi:putative spermidine/putrescine transport system permease protein